MVHLEDRQVLVCSVYEGRGRHDACLLLVVAHAHHDVEDGVLVPVGAQQEVASVDCVCVRVCQIRERPHMKAYCVCVT